MWQQIKTNPWRYIIIAVAAFIVIFALILLSGSLWNSYKESRFLKAQANADRQIQQLTLERDVAKAEEARQRELSKQKDAQVADLQNQIESLRAEVGQKKIVYVNSRKPVTLRPAGAGVSDAELRADAKRLGIVIR